jgi:hypothetical protein
MFNFVKFGSTPCDNIPLNRITLSMSLLKKNQTTQNRIPI